MELSALQSQAPRCCRTASASFTGTTSPKIRPVLCSFSQSSLCHRGFTSVSFAPQMAAGSGYPRRRQKKSLIIPKTKSRSSPKGFGSKTQAAPSVRKKDQIGKEENPQPTPLYGEYLPPEVQKTRVISMSTASKHADVLREEELGDVTDEAHLTGDQSVALEVQKTRVISTSTASKHTDVLREEEPGDVTDEAHLTGDQSVAFSYEETEEESTQEKVNKINASETVNALREAGQDQFPGTSSGSGNSRFGIDGKQGGSTLLDDSFEALLKQQVEAEAQAKKKLVEDLAAENFLEGNKFFTYPKVVEPDQEIEVFFNRSTSALASEPDVLIMGAFNDWKWRSFSQKLQKSADLKGDWWSCKLHVPKQAYKIDFVFFNGGSTYENNESKDFCIAVEGGMDVNAFEDFLLEEKRMELEKLAAEQAERERLAEEQRRIEAENAAREADRAAAKLEAVRKRDSLRNILHLAFNSVVGLWHIEPGNFRPLDRVRLFYNRSSRPLAHAQETWIHGGYNNWGHGVSFVEQLKPSGREDDDWWFADVVVPDGALVLDWVFADGPPQSATVYDNNNYRDFHASVPHKINEELYWVEEEQRIFKRLQEERKIREEALRKKAEKAVQLKAEMKKKTMKKFLLSQKHIFYTDPLDVYAGSIVTVFYNPSNTILNGKPEVWFRCSFNRWTHRNGALPPQKMVASGNSSHVKATVKVPLDAYMVDFVFSEREDGGIYDNKNGMDYHIPVTGGLSREPPLQIVHISVEMAPIAKVGGLGDVVTSLSRAVQDLGHCVEVILPKYDCSNLNNVRDFHFSQSFTWGGTEIKVWHGKVEELPVYFIEPQNGMFSAGCVYGCRNDAERFGFFCHAALEYLLQKGAHPDILHCHDWSSAPVAWLYKEHYKHYGLSNARVVFTIHNLEFGVPFIGKAMLHADKATTVSPTYSREVSGNSAIAPHRQKFYGILNGIDPDIWDPYNDNFIPIPYTSDNVVEGKKASKDALQGKLGLKRSDLPLVGIITRLTFQKGIHLIKHAIFRTLERNGQVVLLGSAPDSRIQNEFVNLANQLHSSHGDQVRLCLTYDEPLSHLIYAGADFILVPSIFEPCGLTQLTAMRYGSIPIVRRTGGLNDTVFDVDHDKERAEAEGLEPNGFSFDGADTGGVDYALDRALSSWYDGRSWFNSLCKRVMEQDWSWNRPALDYMELYHAARKLNV